MDYPLSKNANFVTFSNRCFYSLQRLFIYLQRHKTLLFAFSWIEKTNDKDYNFWEKPWTVLNWTPLEKCKLYPFFSNRCFYRLKSLFLYVEREKTLFFGIFSLKRKGEKNYSFWQKPWTTPFKKMQILRLFQIDLFIVYKGYLSI